MKTAEELRAEIEALGVAYRAIEDKAAAEKREITAEEGEKIDALYAKLETAKKDLAEAEKAEKRRAEARAAFSDVPGARREAARTVGEPNPETTGGFRDLGEFTQAVHAAHDRVGGDFDPRLNSLAAPTDHHREGGSTDGYMVPPDFRKRIWEAVEEAGDVFGLFADEVTGSNQVQALTDETTPWGAAGIQAHWVAEGKKLSASRLATNLVDVKLHKLAVFALSTDELLTDAQNLASRIERKASLAIAWKLGEAFLFGDGTGKPLGFFESGAKVTVAKESGQAADTLDDQNILKMYSRLLMMPGSSPVWVGNNDIVPQLGGLQIGDRPAWLPSERPLAGKPQGTLAGLPLLFSEHAKTIGDEGDLMLMNPGGYASYRKAGIRHDTSIHLYFDYDVEAFRWIVRIGGQPVLSAPVSPANGPNTKSHFITLAARA